MILIKKLRAQNFRSLANVMLENLPSVVLLYGENDAGKSNILNALGAWFALCQAIGHPSAGGARRLHGGFQERWNDARATEVLGPRWESLFRHDKPLFEIEAQLEVREDPEALLYTFHVGVRRWQEGTPTQHGVDVGIETALWPVFGDVRRNQEGKVQPSIPADAVPVLALEKALAHPWMKFSAERRFDPEAWVGGSSDAPFPLLNPAGSNLKQYLFRAANSKDPDQRDAFERFVSLTGGDPFQLPRPLVAIEENSRLDLLFDKESIEDRGSGVQQWVLMAGLFAMSRASVVGIEEPEAHLAWDSQSKLASRLSGPLAGGPHQVFVATHSPLFIDLLREDQGLRIKASKDGTQVEWRSKQDMMAEFPRSPEVVVPSEELVLFPANVVRLSDDLVRHLDVKIGERIFASPQEPGFLLIGEGVMRAALSQASAEAKSENDD